MNDRLRAGLQELGNRMSLTAPEFAKVCKHGGDMLLDGLRSRGLVNERGGRVALSDKGKLALEDGHGVQSG